MADEEPPPPGREKLSLVWRRGERGEGTFGAVFFTHFAFFAAIQRFKSVKQGCIGLLRLHGCQSLLKGRVALPFGMRVAEVEAQGYGVRKRTQQIGRAGS